jgi:hypothetical protein
MKVIHEKGTKKKVATQREGNKTETTEEEEKRGRMKEKKV